MTYRISGLDPSAFAQLFGLSDEELAERSIVRMAVTERPGFPCRISLDDVAVGGSVLLLNRESVREGPYTATHAIFVAEGAERAVYDDEVPPALERRILSLRAFGADHMMVDAALVQPGEADGAIRRLFDSPAVDYIHAAAASPRRWSGHEDQRGASVAGVRGTGPRL